MGEGMSGDEVDDSGDLSRYCSFTRLDDGIPNGGAFRPKQNERYLSVNWLQYFGNIEREDQIECVRKVFIDKDRKLQTTARFAVMNVGEVTEYVRQNSPDARELSVYREEDDDPQDPSHGGIHGYRWEDDLIADLIAFCVQETFPAKSE